MRSSLRLLFTYIGVVVGLTTHPLPNDTTLAPQPVPPPGDPRITGFRLDSEWTRLHEDKEMMKDRYEIPPDKHAHVYYYGYNLLKIDKINIVRGNCAVAGHPDRTIDATTFKKRTNEMIVFTFASKVGDFQICAIADGKLIQPEDSYMDIHIPEVPPRAFKLGFFWVELIVLVVLHFFSAFFSGLSLGLMTLTVRELEIIAKSGSEQEQKYAKAILPLRKKGNQLLCTLLLGNTVCNATISILIDDLLPEANASIPVATLTMLLLGEILPQSICVNNALATGARMLFFARFFLYLFAVFAWPISKVLDLFVGEEHESYDRKRLMELMNRVIANGSELDDDELKIAAGALNLKGKVVSDAMTKINDVFMLPETATLNATAIAAIVRAGYTRIPVFRAGHKTDICDVLITKDLALIDPDDNYTVQMLCHIYKRPIPKMTHDTPMFNALQTFRKGDDGHLAIVSKDDETIGIITLEDVVEEILQEEIKDEFDLKREKRGKIVWDEKILWDTKAPLAVMGKQLSTVTYQFCVANEEAFAERLIDKITFQRIMGSCTKSVDMTHLKPFGGALTVPLKQLPRSARLYTKDEMSDRYILILEGRAEVTIGQGGMKFEAGPFHRFGQELLKKLMQHANELCKESNVDKQLMQFKPDFSVAVFEDCTFLEVTAETYIKALRVTKMTRERGSNGAVYANFKSPGMTIEPSPTRAPLMGVGLSKERTSREEVVRPSVVSPGGRPAVSPMSPLPAVSPSAESEASNRTTDATK